MHFLKNYFTVSLLIIICLLGVGAFFCLSFYNHPTIDDFGHADAVKRYGRIAFQEFQFQHRTGRYASTLIVALINPLIYANWLTGIKIYPVLFLIIFIITLTYFLYQYFNQRLTYIQTLPFSLVLFICFILEMESVQELFYWFAANCVYGIPLILFLLQLVLLTKLLSDKEPQKAVLNITGIAFLSIIQVGSNELALVNTVTLNFAVLVYLFYTNSKKTGFIYLIAFLLISGAAFFSLSAPGNLARAKTLNNDIITTTSVVYVAKILLIAAQYLLIKIKNWIFGLPLVSTSFLLAILIWKYQVKPVLRFKNLYQIVLYIAAVFLTLIMQLFLVLFSTGLSGLVDRAVNVIWFNFFIYWVVGLFLLIPYLKEDSQIIISLNRKLQTRLLNLILIMFLAGILSSFHVVQAYQDLFFKASKYDAGLKSRYATLRKARNNHRLVLAVPPVLANPQAYPKTIFKVELSPDSAHYFNSSVASYFGLRSIKLVDPSVPELP